MNRWLQGFAFRTNLSVGIFLLSALAAIVIAVVTISSQVIRAARANPAVSLKYE
jgi:putative ABC transport system permease protein